MSNLKSKSLDSSAYLEQSDGRLRVGDIVRLNSGSPRLTVEALKDYGRVEVSWFNNGDIERTTLAVECVRADRSEA